MARMEMDLFGYARERGHPEKTAGQPTTWEEPGATLWGRAWLANVHRIYGPRFASTLTFGERLLQEGRLTSCRVRRAHVQAAFDSREGGMVVVNLGVRPLPAERWTALDALCERCGETLLTADDDLPDDVVAGLFEPSEGLLPEPKDFAFSCSHCRTPFCVYRAATLLAAAAEFDRAPIKLFELRGAGQGTLLARSVQQTQTEGDAIPEEDLSALFGIDFDR
jgi:uncharacterized Zn finger protein